MTEPPTSGEDAADFFASERGENVERPRTLLGRTVRRPVSIALGGVSVEFADRVVDETAEKKLAIDQALEATRLVNDAIAAIREQPVELTKTPHERPLFDELLGRAAHLTDADTTAVLQENTSALLHGLQLLLSNPATGSSPRLDQVGRDATALTDALARTRLQRTLSQAERALTPSGTAGMAQHFYWRAKNEERAANRLRLAVVGLLTLIAAGAAGVAFSFSKESSVATEVSKLAIAIPLLGLAYYLSKEASQHRGAAQRAREIEVRLRTVIPYTSELNDADKLTIRADLGRLVFGALPNAFSLNTVGLDPAALTGIVSDAVKLALERGKAQIPAAERA
jgi:hypothetical protein